MSKAILLQILLLQIAFCAVAQKAKFEFFSTRDGLAGNHTTSMAQDDQGFLWIVNENKLLRFDGRNFLSYPAPPIELPGSKETPKVVHSYQDSLLFIQTRQYVLLLNPKTGNWQSFKCPEVDSLNHSICYSYNLSATDIFVATVANEFKKELALWRFSNQQFERIITSNNKFFLNTLDWYTSDSLGNAYLFTADTLQIFGHTGNLTSNMALPVARGAARTTDAKFAPGHSLNTLTNRNLLIFDTKQKAWRPHPANRFLNYPSLSLNHFLIENNGSFWAAGGDRNLVYYNALRDTLYDFHDNLVKLIPYSFDLQLLLIDRSGTIWADGQLGLIKVTPQFNDFDTYFNALRIDNTYNSFRGITEDSLGFIYCCYYSGLSNNTGGARIDPAKKEGILNAFPVVMPFGIYAEGCNIWLNNGNMWNSITKKMTVVPGSIPYGSRDWGLFTKDNLGTLWWIYESELYYLEKARSSLNWKVALRLPTSIYSSPDAFHTGQKSGLLWIGFQEHLFGFSPVTKKLQQYGPKVLGFSFTRILAIEEDAEGNLWLGTDIGLIRFNPSDGTALRYSKENGLPNNYICGILPQGDSCLWLSTSYGLSRFHLKHQSFANFFEEDGLSNNDFNRASYFKASNGRMFFGGKQGVNSFFPQELMQAYRRNNESARMVLSSFEYINESGDSLLRRINFSQNPVINIQASDRSFMLEYALTDYNNSNEIYYSYRMEGYEEAWSTPSKFNFTRFSSLPKGTYVFHVKARNNRGLWNQHELAIKIIVHPPWWDTWWAYLLFGLILMGILYLSRRYELNRQALKANLKVEKLEAEKLKELDHFKGRLYTNITHELRTPLTVILGMISQIREQPKKHLQEGARLIENNSKSLLRLINQLLDLSKLENNAFQLHLEQSDIVPYLRYITDSFQSYANSKNLSLRFVSPLESLILDYDPEQLKQVMTNLISNAIKFTPSGGDIQVRLKDGTSDKLYIEVLDTGIGIAEKDLPHVFDRFYQVDGSITRHVDGTGIGLAHSLELVKIMGGDITLESSLGKGSHFTIILPIRREALLSNTLRNKDTLASPMEAFDNAMHSISESETPEEVHNLPQLLIIEDNPDTVVYLKSFLSEFYQLDVAYNGKVGIEKALHNIPDVIISDLMMPEKDGYQVCETLKNDTLSSHIPIILLTAKADNASKIAGLRRGADAYLIKPFDKEELLVRLKMLMERQKRIVDHFSNSLFTKSTVSVNEPEIEETILIEDAFIQKVRLIVSEHYSDDNFSLPELCRKLGMSRSQLFRKMTALIGTSPSDYIRSYRLNQAKILLETTDLNVSEVAWEVGFKDLAHFSKLFREEFELLPSALNK